MLGLYEYNEASYEECMEDLNTTVDDLYIFTQETEYGGDLDALERRGIRIQNIAKRLKELEEENA